MADKMIREAIALLAGRKSLSRDMAVKVMEEIMDGSATPAQIGAFLVALSLKGEAPEEIAGMAAVMRAMAIPVNAGGPLLDVVGTGGDGLNTLNISTTAAFVVAGTGVKVAKHGNRASSGKCGSADVLEKLGVRISLTAGQVEKCITEAGIGFIFAPAFHPAMKQVAGARREIGIRTVFNLLGPLTNPAGAEYMLLGVPGIEVAERIVPALQYLGYKHVLVVSGLNGMDEVTTTDSTLVWEIKNGGVSDPVWIKPEDYGIERGKIDDIRGGTAEENAAKMAAVLQGECGPARDVVMLNAAAALLAAEKAGSLAEGLKLAQHSLDSFQALSRLEKLIDLTNSFQDG
ncbi:MAG TPA: anthranilate phosphoribosyltransferase [Dehalococcoidales bacterium]|nr:anthranilate phosphoribosyltransferase [Dehalococcoidales bacterium]